MEAWAESALSRVMGELNGLPVLRFDGTNDMVSFTTRLTTIRSVFWVVRETATTNGYRLLLGDTAAYDFHSNSTRKIWDPGYASASVRGGETRINGVVVDGTTTDRPTAMSVVSLVTTGPVSASSLTNDRGYGRYWWGDVAELVIYDRALGDGERRQVEDYLARRYALYAPARRAPAISPPGGSFAEPVAVMLTGEGSLYYTLDGSDPTEASTLYTGPFVVAAPVTVKARAFAPSGGDPSGVATATFLDSGEFSPASVSGLKIWVRADAGTAGDPSLRVGTWTDQSGNANHLTQAGPWRHPALVPNAAGALPALRFDGVNDFLGFTTRLTTIRTVFWVARESASATNGYRYLLGDSTYYDFSSGSARTIWDGYYTHASVLQGQTRLNGAVVNGAQVNRPTAMSVLSLVTTGAVRADSFSADRTYGRHWWGDLAELIVYDTALSDTDRRAVEEYLASRYGITLQ